MTTRPFIESESGTLDMGRIRDEAFPLAGLIALFAGLALVPFVLVVVTGGRSGIGFIMSILSQFIVAIGAGIVLMYVIARGIQLGEA